MIYLSDDTLEKRSENLTKGLQSIDMAVLRGRSQRGFDLVRGSLLQFASVQCLGAGETRKDQEWLKIGAAANITAKYSALICALPRRAVVEGMMADRPRGLRAGTVDLLSPVDITEMRREAVMIYEDARWRKSVKVVDDLLLRCGDDALPKVLKTVRERKPTDGRALIDLIKDLTGTDVTPWLRPV